MVDKKDRVREKLDIAIEALKDIRAGRPELDDWGDHDPVKIARNALRRIAKASV